MSGGEGREYKPKTAHTLKELPTNVVQPATRASSTKPRLTKDSSQVYQERWTPPLVAANNAARLHRDVRPHGIPRFLLSELHRESPADAPRPRDDHEGQSFAQRPSG
jgi:hypothetical protein